MTESSNRKRMQSEALDLLSKIPQSMESNYTRHITHTETASPVYVEKMVVSQPSQTENPEFRAALTDLLNRYSVENGSDTPDFILADYLIACLNGYNIAVKQRTNWYSK